MLGWTVERGAIRREVEAIALETEYYLEKRLLALETKFKNLIPPKRRSGWNRVLVELDGCQIRTGGLLSSQTEELTPLRRLKKRKRKIDWREVRVGLARPVEHRDSRTFIARMGRYPELVPQLHSAAVDQGLSIYTLVFGVAEGGNGLSRWAKLFVKKWTIFHINRKVRKVIVEGGAASLRLRQRLSIFFYRGT